VVGGRVTGVVPVTIFVEFAAVAPEVVARPTVIITRRLLDVKDAFAIMRSFVEEIVVIGPTS
jgi:hypothetical protein